MINQFSVLTYKATPFYLSPGRRPIGHCYGSLYVNVREWHRSWIIHWIRFWTPRRKAMEDCGRSTLRLSVMLRDHQITITLVMIGRRQVPRIILSTFRFIAGLASMTNSRFRQADVRLVTDRAWVLQMNRRSRWTPRKFTPRNGADTCTDGSQMPSWFIPALRVQHRAPFGCVKGHFPIITPVHESIEQTLQSYITILRITSEA